MTYDFSYIYPQMEAESKKQASIIRFLDKPLGCHCYDNAYVLPSKDLWKDGKCFGGVVTEYGQFVESSAWHEGNRCDKYEFDINSVVTDEGIAIYMGFYFSCWGHAITDNLKKLWFLETEECKKLLRDGAKIIYLTTNNLLQPDYVGRLFRLAGVDLDRFQLVTSITKFRKVYIPDNSFIADKGQRYFTQLYVDTITRIKNNVLNQFSRKELELFPKKIYFTRTHIKTMRDWGEKSVEKAFRKCGYTIVAPEEYSVEKQISLLLNCTHFATTEGSISHNVLFCNPNTNVAIIRKCYDVNKYQMALNEISDVNVTYIDAHHSIMAPHNSPWVGPFYIYVNSQLASFLGGKCKQCYPYYLSFSWWGYCYQESRIVKKICQIVNA